MPILVPPRDGRRYEQLLAETLARIPVHNPEWTNFNRSDPGVTLVELFAFLAESLVYRADQIPERNRKAFLALLGVPLQPAQPARGLVAVSNERGPLRTVTLPPGVEVRAGQIPFRTGFGLDVLPVESRVYRKRPEPLTPQLREVYRQMFASFLGGDGPGSPALDPRPYETVVLDGTDPAGVDLVADTVDGSLWVALCARAGDDPEQTRQAIGGAVLALGLVPLVTDIEVTLPAGGFAAADAPGHLEFLLPSVPAGGLPPDPLQRVARYRAVEGRPLGDVNVLLRPGVVQLTLPPADELRGWDDLEPLEDGVDEFPPAIADPALRERVVTWVRVRATSAAQARLLWAGVNVVPVDARSTVADELLPPGTGRPDQVRRLSTPPVLPGTVRLTVTPPGQPAATWAEIDDLLAAGPEVPVPDLRLPPGAAATSVPGAPVRVFALDAEAGLLRFGDGLHGARPPDGAVLRVGYDSSAGAAANVTAGTITTGTTLPPGFTVTNPVRTWGGTDAESVADGERQVARYLQHRDRLVTAEDFATVAARTPGVEIGRVEVVPAFDPRLAPALPGGAPGAVTLLLVPRRDPVRPEAPAPDRFFLDAVCHYLDQRRLVTTELHLRGPDYRPVWVSVGIDVVAGASVTEVRDRVGAELTRVLSPLPLRHQVAAAGTPATYPHAGSGWPLWTAVTRAELVAYATRVAGVRVVTDLLLGAGGGPAAAVDMTGLQLPLLAGVSVVAGEPVALDRLRGEVADRPVVRTVPVPRMPEDC